MSVPEKAEFKLTLKSLGDPAAKESIRDILCSALGLEVQAVDLIIENAPVAIKKSDSQEELRKLSRLLNEAGAAVEITSEQGKTEASDSSASDAWSLELDEAADKDENRPPGDSDVPETLSLEPSGSKVENGDPQEVGTETPGASLVLEEKDSMAQTPASNSGNTQRSIDGTDSDRSQEENVNLSESKTFQESRLGDLIKKKTESRSSGENPSKEKEKPLENRDSSDEGKKMVAPANVAVLVLGLLLLLGIPFIIMQTNSNSGHKIVSVSRKNTVKKPKFSAAATSGKNESSPKIKTGPQEWKFARSTESYSLSGSISSQKGVVTSAFFSFTTPPPRELTPEEIVHGATKPPWPKKGKTISINFVRNSADAFEGRGRCKVVVDDQGNITPVFADFTLKGSINPDTKSASVRAAFINGTKDEGKESEFASIRENNTYKFIVAGTATASAPK